MIEQILGHLLSWLLEKKLADDALSPAAKSEWQEVWDLKHSLGSRVMWTLMTVVWGLVVVGLIWLAVQGPIGWLALALPPFLACLLYSVVTARNALTQEIEVSAWGITERRFGVDSASFPWSAVTEVRFVGLLDAYRVRSRDGRVIQFNRHIQGLPSFKECARRHVPAEATDLARL